MLCCACHVCPPDLPRVPSFNPFLSTRFPRPHSTAGPLLEPLQSLVWRRVAPVGSTCPCLFHWASCITSDRMETPRILGKATRCRRVRCLPGQVRSKPARGNCTVRAEAFESASSTGGRIEELRRLTSGTGNGTGCTPERKARIEELVQELERTNPSSEPARLPLQNTTWTLLYSNTGGNSSGKLGPFVGRVTQSFDERDGFANTVGLGALKLALHATYEVRSDHTIVVRFQNTEFSAFGFNLFNNSFERTAVGSWRVTYATPELRVLYSNKDNVFVLARS